MDGPVYGDFLTAFPELLKEYAVFYMKALPGGTYGPRESVNTVLGALRFTPGGKMGIQGENRQPNAVASFWCFPDEEEKIRQGMYIEVEKKGIFILTKDNGYESEGGFLRYTVALVPGPTDKQKPAPPVAQNATDDF